MYCGSPLPAEVLESAGLAVRSVIESPSLQALEFAAIGAVEGRPPKRYVVVETDRVPVETLAAGCSVSVWEARQWRTASRYRLLRISAEPTDGAFESDLRSRGIHPLSVAEDQVARARNPVTVEAMDLSGNQVQCTVREDTESHALRRELLESELTLIVSGPIKQERVKDQAPRLRSDRRMEEAWLVHLHFKNEIRPWEIDPRRTAYQGPGLASAHMRTLELARRLSSEIPWDENFKNLVPALAPALTPPDDLRALAKENRKRDHEAKTVLLDNVAQFREYSAWRAAVERLR